MPSETTIDHPQMLEVSIDVGGVPLTLQSARHSLDKFFISLSFGCQSSWAFLSFLRLATEGTFDVWQVWPKPDSDWVQELERQVRQAHRCGRIRNLKRVPGKGEIDSKKWNTSKKHEDA